MSPTQVQMKFGPVQLGIIILTVATALIHFTLVFPSTLFILNGLGYLTLLGLLYLPVPQLAEYRRYFRWALLGYAALTILLWAVTGSRIPLAYINKTIEVALIILLIVEDKQSYPDSTSSRTK